MTDWIRTRNFDFQYFDTVVSIDWVAPSVGEIDGMLPIDHFVSLAVVTTMDELKMISVVYDHWYSLRRMFWMKSSLLTMTFAWTCSELSFIYFSFFEASKSKRFSINNMYIKRNGHLKETWTEKKSLISTGTKYD